MQDILAKPSVLKTIYGVDKIPVDSWLNYAYALLVIAGADGEVSAGEMLWLEQDFARIVEVPQGFRSKIKSFKWKEADLAPILAQIKSSFPMNYLRALIYDSIKMSMADRNFDSSEKEAARKAAELLNMPLYVARTIEGLVNTEKSVSDIRQSIFELDEALVAKFPKRSFDQLAFMQAFSYGMSLEMHLNYGYALMTVAGADGQVAPKELEWYKKEFAPMARVPANIVEKVVNFNYRVSDLKHIFAQIKDEITINFGKMLIYHSIKMARADSIYADEERNMVDKTSKLLNVPADIAQTIQYLIDTEERIEKMRKTLFEVKK